MKLKDHYFDWISSEDYELDLKRQTGIPLGRVSDPLEGVKIQKEYPRYSEVRKRLVARFKSSGTSIKSFKGK